VLILLESLSTNHELLSWFDLTSPRQLTSLDVPWMMNRGRRKSAGVGGKSTPNQVRLEYGENNVNVGPLKDIPEICVDHFYGDDLKSSVFFLTHAHTGEKT